MSPRAAEFDAHICIKLNVSSELLARFRAAQQRAKRRGERYQLSDIVRDSMLAFALHHEGIAQRPAIDPQQLDLYPLGAMRRHTKEHK